MSTFPDTHGTCKLREICPLFCSELYHEWSNILENHDTDSSTVWGMEGVNTIRLSELAFVAIPFGFYVQVTSS